MMQSFYYEIFALNAVLIQTINYQQIQEALWGFGWCSIRKSISYFTFDTFSVGHFQIENSYKYMSLSGSCCP